MKRLYDYVKSGVGLLLCAAVNSPYMGFSQEKKYPNFVWFTVEDVSKHFLQLYDAGGAGAVMPQVNRLAREGIIFNNAFCNAPVSSAARSTLFSGYYAPRAGISWHRALDDVNLEQETKLVSGYLKEAGYYTVNSNKTDYNFVMPDNSWDDVKASKGQWRNRPDKNQPFFYVENCAISHESCLHFLKERMKKIKPQHDPEKVKLFPNHPDTELMRYTYATFYDRIQDTDVELGKLIDMLEEENELDDTFIFFFGDNGGALPGTKGYTGEAGLHVPLVIYIPRNWRDQVNLIPGSRVDGFVSFLDFGPTLLQLAGIEIPDHMDGKPFLGKEVLKKELDGRDIVFGYGDRFDELYAFSRTVRKGQYKYKRNFIPYQPEGSFIFYRYKMEAFQEWRNLYHEGKLNAVQRRFFDPQEPEELYDLSVDPYETNNLAKNPSSHSTLVSLREILRKHMLESRDLGFFPESEWLEKGKTDPVRFGEIHHEKMKAYSDIMDLGLIPFSQATNELKRVLKSTDTNDIYWGLTTCLQFGEEAKELQNEVTNLLDHPSPVIRSRAVTFLSVLRQINPSLYMTDILRSAGSGAESLIILGDMAYLKEYISGSIFTVSEDDVKYPAGSYQWRINFIMDKN
ncbi:Arylsulfatase A [Porphyromonadaceae bacterium KH3R12]|nr:Arylsulfatase A [Porphyromonadaceae bacterium KH3R12]